MNITQMKSLLHRDKVFLKNLYKSDSVQKSRRLITFATDSEITTLFKYLHFISNGEIPIKKENFSALEKKHLLLFKKKLQNKHSFSLILQLTRKDKLQILMKLIKIFCHLLTPLFQE